MATLNVNKVNTRHLTGLRLVTGTIDFDASYPTGGEAISLPLSEVNGMLIENKAGYSFEYDRVNKKVKAFTPTVQHTHDLLLTGGQAAGDALQQLAGVVGKTAAGNVTAAGGASNIQNKAAAAASEVANATDLSALTGVAFLAWGW